MSEPSKSPRRGIRPKADIGQTNIPGDPPPIKLPLSALQVDFAIQQRAGMNPALIEEYASNITNWIDEAPIEVFADADQVRWVADGFHRVEAARRAGLDAISARQRPGTRRDALLFAVSANQRHGLRRTQADKRRAVETLLLDPEWCQWSDRMIAEKAGVDHKTVAAIRRESVRWGNSPPGSTPPAVGDPAPSAGNDPATKRRGRDGKAYSVRPPMSDAERAAWDEGLKEGGQMIADFAERQAEREHVKAELAQQPAHQDAAALYGETLAHLAAADKALGEAKDLAYFDLAFWDAAMAHTTRIVKHLEKQAIPCSTARPKRPAPKDAMHAAHGVTGALGLLRKVETALLEEDARVLMGELRQALDRLSARFEQEGTGHA